MNLYRSRIDILRTTESTGYFDENENWVDGVGQTSIPIKCSIQPYNKGRHRIELPEGVRADSAIIIYTGVQIFNQDDLTSRSADELIYKGNKFECFDVEDWTEHGLKSDHIKALFIRKDKT